MNRQQALEWLVEHVTKWPVSGVSQRSPKGYYRCCSNGVMLCISEGAPDMDVITQQDWLEATDK